MASSHRKPQVPAGVKFYRKARKFTVFRHPHTVPYGKVDFLIVPNLQIGKESEPHLQRHGNNLANTRDQHFRHLYSGIFYIETHMKKDGV
jgi:hypothetical protein